MPAVELDLYEELTELLAALEAEGVRYALCGALALAVHGLPRATRAIDLIAPPEDVDALVTVAKARGFSFEALPMRFSGTDVEVRRLTKLAGGRPLVLDILVVNETLEAVWDGRLSLEWARGQVVVVSRRGLVSMKLTAGRPQDLVDIERLQALEDET